MTCSNHFSQSSFVFPEYRLPLCYPHPTPRCVSYSVQLWSLPNDYQCNSFKKLWLYPMSKMTPVILGPAAVQNIHANSFSKMNKSFIYSSLKRFVHSISFWFTISVHYQQYYSASGKTKRKPSKWSFMNTNEQNGIQKMIWRGLQHPENLTYLIQEYRLWKIVFKALAGKWQTWPFQQATTSQYSCQCHVACETPLKKDSLNRWRKVHKSWRSESSIFLNAKQDRKTKKPKITSFTAVMNQCYCSNTEYRIMTTEFVWIIHAHGERGIIPLMSEQFGIKCYAYFWEVYYPELQDRLVHASLSLCSEAHV